MNRYYVRKVMYLEGLIDAESEDQAYEIAINAHDFDYSESNTEIDEISLIDSDKEYNFPLLNEV